MHAPSADLGWSPLHLLISFLKCSRASLFPWPQKGGSQERFHHSHAMNKMTMEVESFTKKKPTNILCISRAVQTAYKCEVMAITTAWDYCKGYNPWLFCTSVWWVFISIWNSSLQDFELHDAGIPWWWFPTAHLHTEKWVLPPNKAAIFLRAIAVLPSLHPCLSFMF